MNLDFKPHAWACRQTLALLVLTLTGCANPNYVVLLPDAGGKLGQVVLSSPKGETLLQSKNQAAVLGGTAGETFQVSDAQVQKDFGAALAASPRQPVSYLLYFEAGGAQLSAESLADLARIQADIGQRPGADISVIGHTDTAGDAQANVALGLTRAQSVAQLIGTAQLAPDHVSVESHGESNPLVSTPDGVNEPRNRRVEVVVR